MGFWEKISSLDRRWIYLLVAISVIFPMLVIIKFPVQISPEAKSLYDAVEALPDSSVVFLTFDYYPSTLAETEPMSVAALHHLFRKNMKIITMTTIPLGGPSIAERVTRDIAAKYGKVYGVDFVNLGYKANYVAVLKGMGSSIEAIYPADNSGTPLRDIPLMKNVKNYNDVKFIYVVADNGIIDNWISIVNAQYNVPIGGGLTAVMAPKMYSFVESKQLVGLLGGMKGAAEYELLVQHEGNAVRGMDAQSMVHLLIIFFVIVGNIGFFMIQRQAKGHKV
jgi:hypothetical protein